MTQPITTAAEALPTQAAWCLAGVFEDAAPQPAPVTTDEPFDPLAGVDEA